MYYNTTKKLLHAGTFFILCAHVRMCSGECVQEWVWRPEIYIKCLPHSYLHLTVWNKPFSLADHYAPGILSSAGLTDMCIYSRLPPHPFKCAYWESNEGLSLCGKHFTHWVIFLTHPPFFPLFQRWGLGPGPHIHYIQTQHYH